MAKLIETRTNYTLMAKPVLTVSIELDAQDPVEVIIEKIKASLPRPMRSFKEGRQHPFDGPEVFDDTPHGEVPHDSVKLKADKEKIAKAMDVSVDEVRLGDDGLAFVTKEGAVYAFPLPLTVELPQYFAPQPGSNANRPKFSEGGIIPPVDGQIFVHEGKIVVPPRSIEDDYPRLRELFEAKRAEVRNQRPAEGEGEWLLNSDDDNIGKDCE